MQDLGISILFKGINFQRLMGGLWVTLRLALITIGLSCLFGLLFGLLEGVFVLHERCTAPKVTGLALILVGLAVSVL